MSNDIFGTIRELNVLNATQKKQLKTVVVVENNVTNALIVEDSLLSRQLSGAIHLKSDNYVSKCILMAWV